MFTSFASNSRRHRTKVFTAFVLAILATFTVQAAPGDLDTSFGMGGKVLTSFGIGGSTGYSVVVQSDGKIVVAGDTFIGNLDFAVARYTAEGVLDTSFGSGGKVITRIGNSTTNNTGYSVALQSDGKILVSGYSITSNRDFALARYTSTGELDTTFGSGGKVTTDFGGSDE